MLLTVRLHGPGPLLLDSGEINSGGRVSQSISLNPAVREYPFSSERYRRVFNQKAESMGFDFRWTRDSHDPNSIEPDELELGADRGCSGHFDGQLSKNLKSVLEQVEKERLELLHKSASYHGHIDFRAPLELLTPVERQAVQILNDEVKPIINRIEARQHTPQADAQAAWMSKHGTPEAKELFQRFHRDQMAGPWYYDDNASLMPTFPEVEPINGMISRDISMQEFQDLAASLPPGSDEMRPTTMLDRQNGEVKSHPLSQDPRFRADHLQLAQSMDKLAALKVEGQGLDPLVSSQLKAWGQYFRSGEAQDEARAVQATIDAGESSNLLRIHLGPSESYWADNVKFPYDLQVGVRDPKIQDEFKKWQTPFLELEQSLADVPNYQPRPLKTRGGFADPIYQAVTGGFVESFYAREVKGVNFPNYPYTGVEGSNRFLLLEAMNPVAAHAREIAGRLLDKVPDKLEETETMYAGFHESGHLLGPQRSHITPGGIPMGLAFGQTWGSVEEPKADLTVSEMFSRRAQDGQLSEADKRTHLEAATNILLSFYPGKQLYRDGKATEHYYGFLLQTGYYLQTGALQLVSTPQGERLHCDPDKIEKASHDLWKKLITFESLGQKDEFVAFGNSVIESIPDSVDSMILKAQGDYRPYFVDHHL